MAEGCHNENFLVAINLSKFNTFSQADMTEDHQNGNLLIGYQLLSFIKISRTEDVYFAVYTAMIFTILKKFGRDWISMV